MILSTQNWTKVIDEFLKVINAQLTWNGKMDKDKWNALNSNFKQIVDYCKGIGHNTSSWDLNIYRWQMTFATTIQLKVLQSYLKCSKASGTWMFHSMLKIHKWRWKLLNFYIGSKYAWRTTFNIATTHISARNLRWWFCDKSKTICKWK
jgi:hypothetical protein